jgi:hypothetical protein
MAKTNAKKQKQIEAEKKIINMNIHLIKTSWSERNNIEKGEMIRRTILRSINAIKISKKIINKS